MDFKSACIKDAYLIYDDLVVVTDTNSHMDIIKEVMEAINKAGLTLNPQKCQFGKTSISYWGMIYSAEGVQPDLAKIEAIHYITPPENKCELISFLCIMQSNADFIPNFAKKSSMLWEMAKGKSRLKW